MARSSETLLGARAWNTGRTQQMLDPALGGQFAWSTNPGEWLSAQAEVPRNIIPMVVEAPLIYRYLPEPQKWVEAYRVFFEKHARTIEGLKAGLTVEKAEDPFGGGGRFFENPTDVKRDRSTLSVGLIEKYGNVWQEFWAKSIRYGIMHEETKTPLSVTLQTSPDDLLADVYSGTIAFIQPDPTGRRVLRCWIGVNIWPQGTGPIDGKMDKTSALSPKELSLDFTILDFIDEGTRQLGQELLDAVNKEWANPQIRKSFIDGLSADIAATAKSWKESVENIAPTRVGDII